MVWVRVVGGMLAAWLWFGATTACAQAEDASVRAHFDAGSSAFKSGDYAAAAREFESAYALSPRPALLYHLYVSHERLGHAAEAANYLQAYLGSADKIENRGALEVELANLKQRIEPTPAPAVLTPPQAPAHDATRAPDGQPAPLPPPVDDDREVSERFVQAMALFGVAATGAVTFAIAGPLALQKDNALAKSCGRDAGRTCTDAQVRGLRTRTTVADVGLGLLGVGALIGATLLWLDRREHARRATTLAPAASFDVHGASFALGGRF